MNFNLRHVKNRELWLAKYYYIQFPDCFGTYDWPPWEVSEHKFEHLLLLFQLKHILKSSNECGKHFVSHFSVFTSRKSFYQQKKKKKQNQRKGNV